MASRGSRWHHVDMHLLVTGIGDAFSDRSFGSSGLIRASGGWLAIDCPGMVLAMWKRAGELAGVSVDPDEVRDLVITHLHGDHCAGLETIGFHHRYKVAGDSPRPRLHAMPQVLDRIWERLAPAMDGSGSTIDDYFDLHPLLPGVEVEIAGCRVECRETRHSVPTCGLVITDGSGCLGWSSDTEYDPEHVRWLERADCIVHECGQGGTHTTYGQLRTLPEPVQARLRIIHMPDDFDAPDGQIVPLREGDWVAVAPGAFEDDRRD